MHTDTRTLFYLRIRFPYVHSPSLPPSHLPPSLPPSFPSTEACQDAVRSWGYISDDVSPALKELMIQWGMLSK